MGSNQLEGNIILVDKPYQWTSFDVVKKLRFHLKVKKIGHAGTLDPLATGLLILCTNNMTKEISKYQNMEKEYVGKMIIGKTTPSYDQETEIDNVFKWRHVTPETVLKKAKLFEGKISQIPPIFSAIKVHGKRAYTKARAGIDFKLNPRDVEVSNFEITNIDLPEISFRLVCSKGTYVRSIVRDFGNELDTGAYLAELCRTRIGKFKIDNAKQLDEICSLT